MRQQQYTNDEYLNKLDSLAQKDYIMTTFQEICFHGQTGQHGVHGSALPVLIERLCISGFARVTVFLR